MNFIREDWTLFRSLNTLPQKAGIPLRQLGALVVKELVDNALDAGANVKVSEEDGWVIIADDGPGIPHEGIQRLFSINRPLTSSKVIRLPTRGALGNGLRVVMGAIYASGGEIIVETGGQDDDPATFQLAPDDNGHTQIVSKTGSYHYGTKIRLRLGPSIPTDQHDLTSLSKMATVLAPIGKHYEGKTSPWWYDEESFFELCQAAGETPLWKLFFLFRDIKKTDAQTICGELLAGQVPKEGAVKILQTLRGLSKEPKPQVLGSIGELHDFHRATDAGVIYMGQGGQPAKMPYVVEVYCRPIEDEDVDHKDKHKDTVQILVNRTLVAGSLKVYRGKPTELYMFGWGLSHAFKLPKSVACRLIVNITTPYMPITTDGKEPDLARFAGPLQKVIEKAANKCRRAVSASVGGVKVSQKAYIEDCLEEAILKASSRGRYRYSLRQLFYAVRPYLLERFPDFDYNYFSSVITQIESERGNDLPGMYRSVRGVLHHPHTGEEIPLGTRAVEEYKRPAWTFNKIIYIEKEGFISLLKEEGWLERNDCAMLTCQGFASRAARDVIDLLGEGDEPIQFFCIHDADASGTMIYQSLVEETKARAKRTVEVINLGLDPEEANNMGLQVETFRTEGGRKMPVASYVDYEWVDWLQTQRVELNAMTSEEFITWLDEKFAPYAGKIVPPKPVMEGAYREASGKAIEAALTTKILEEGQFTSRFSTLFNQVEPGTKPLEAIVRADLEETPEHRWDKPLVIAAGVEAVELVKAEKKPKKEKK